MLPIFFLSGALYPLRNLPKALTIITHMDPLSYGVDGLRGVLIGSWQFNFVLDVVLLLGLMAVFLSLGAYLFSRIQL